MKKEPDPPTERHSREQSGSVTEKLPFSVAAFLFLVILVPVELSFFLGTLFLTASKFFLILVAIVIIPSIPKINFKIYDWLFVCHVLWSVLAFNITLGTAAGLEAGGTYILEFLIVYLSIRVFVTNIGQLMTIVRILFLMILIVTIAAIPEAYLHKRFIHDFASSLTGITYRFDDELRLGILRSASFFEHPILHGMFCSALLSLVWFTSSGWIRLYKAAIITFGTFLSASSAPLLVLVLQFALIFGERITRSIKRRFSIFVTMSIGAVIFLNVVSGRGAIGWLASLTLNPHTAYTRRTQWQHGIDDVMRNPIFGIDPLTWTRPEWLARSIDNYWLFVMVRSGIPSLLFLALAVFFIWRKLANSLDETKNFRNLRTGWGLMMVSLILGGATVTFFGRLQPLFALYIGLGAVLASIPPNTTGSGPKVVSGERKVRYSRFQ